MATFLPIRGTKTEIDNTPIVDGQFLMTTDLGVGNKIYLDEGTQRIDLNSKSASSVIISDTNNYFTSGNVEGALSEVGNTVVNIENELVNINIGLAQKANQTALDVANANISSLGLNKADKSEVTNVMTPKGNIAYASLPTTGNTVGWYYYCSDGDGTNGAGNYVWNGASWYFGGTGDEGYNILKGNMVHLGEYNLMPSEIHFNEWYQLNGGGAQVYNGYCWFKVDNPDKTKHDVRYGVYKWNGTTFVEISVYYYFTLATAPSAGAQGNLSATLFHESLNSLYISTTMAIMKDEIIVCNVNDIGYITKNYPRKALVNSDGVALNLDNCIIKNIVNPYIYKDEHNNITIKFDKIEYDFNGVSSEYTVTDLATDITTKWEYDYAFEYDVYKFTLTEHQMLLFSPTKHKIYIETTKQESDVLLVYLEDEKTRGMLVDFYDRFINDNKSRLLWNSLTNDMISQLDSKEDLVVTYASSDNFVFGYLSDDHATGWQNRYRKYTAMGLSRVSKSIGIDTIINAGDSVLSAGGCLNALRKQFEFTDKSDVIYCQGNHDRYIIEPILSQNDFFNFMYRNNTSDTSFHFGNPPATYFYKNFADKKIRVVVLDLYDIPSEYNYNDHNGYRQSQLEWLRDDALVINSDWSVIVVTHSSPCSSTDGMTNNTGGQGNRELLPLLLKAFKNGTSVHLTNTTTLGNVFNVNMDVDFTSQGARNLIGVFTGHNHTDVILVKDNINYISIACGYIDVVLYMGKLGYRYQDNYSAMAFDIVIVDTATKNVKLKRFGWGSDREFNY